MVNNVHVREIDGAYGFLQLHNKVMWDISLQFGFRTHAT